MANKVCWIPGLLAALMPPALAVAAAQENVTEEPRPSVEQPYAGYKPDFIEKELCFIPKDKEQMDLSFEPAFYTLTDLCGYSKPEPRSAALVKKGLEREQQGEYREAIEIYQKVIEDYPDDLHRVSGYGVYVPVAQWCQQRILRFPKSDLEFYRTKHDARAKDAFDQAWRKHSLEGLAEITGRMLATAYGGRAMLALGDTALDRGHYLEALEYYRTVRDRFPDEELRTRELALKIDFCRKLLGDPPRAAPREPSGGTRLEPGDLETFARSVATAQPQDGRELAQLASEPHVAADDYVAMPPTKDPLALKSPVWEKDLEGARAAVFVFTQPVVTEKSVVYRHRNLVSCRSILNGELRWRCDIGGRKRWQSPAARQYPAEDLVVCDGRVITPIDKSGATLVALDEITGRLAWAYGPMVASTEEEANLRFEAAPAAGSGSVYAGYVLDNIRGVTHIDSEYGLMAFEAKTGRIRWRTPVCRLRPGGFSASLVGGRRNRIRSFTSPPLYHQGTIYYCTNAGAVAALDALSGRIKWVMRYPCDPMIHDAARPWGDGGDSMRFTNEMYAPHSPMLWYNQRPRLVGEDLYVLPVDAESMFKIDRRTGKIHWTRRRRDKVHNLLRMAGGSSSYFLGPIPSGELVEVHSFRSHDQDSWHGPAPKGCVFLIDPQTGEDVWVSEDPVAKHTEHATVALRFSRGHAAPGQPVTFDCLGANVKEYQVAARPFLASDGTLCLTQYAYWAWPLYSGASNLAVLDLGKREVVARRHYLSGGLLTACAGAIENAPYYLERAEDVPHKSDELKREIEMLRAIANDTVPENEHPAFQPFSRITFERYGTLFELRTTGRSMAMVYDREKVDRAVSAGKTPDDLLAAAELAVGDSRFAEAADLMKRCLAATAPDDLDFRALVNQQLFKAYARLAQGSIRAGDTGAELAYATGMSNTPTTLSDEIKAWFALSDVFQRQGDLRAAGRYLRTVVNRYGHHELAIPSLLAARRERVDSTMTGILDGARSYVEGAAYTPLLANAMDLSGGALPLYFSTLSPLEQDLTLRAGDWAASKLRDFRTASAPFAEAFEKDARDALRGKPTEEQLARLLEYPGTEAAQEVLTRLLKDNWAALSRPDLPLAEAAAARRRLWELADAANTCGLDLGGDFRQRLLAPPARPSYGPVRPPMKEREIDLEDAEGTAWLVLERRGQRHVRPNLLFLGGRVRKKTDNKFVLRCLDTASGEVVWNGREPRGDTWFEEIRLKGQGDEPGFVQAFVHGDIIVVHGLYDVLAFGLADGRLKWRYRVPVGFEIEHALASGDLLVLSGPGETAALYMPTADPRGEVAWQQKEEGAIYAPAYLDGDRLVSVRKMPFNLTVRYRTTGRLMGRLALPDLTLDDEHPIHEKAPRGLPVMHEGERLALSDGRYVVMVDTRRMKIVWKRLLEQGYSPLRFALGGDYLAVTKKDYDLNSIYMLSASDGNLLWHTDPKDGSSPQPLYSMQIRDGRLYGIGLHPGQGFFLVGRDCRTGEHLFKPTEQTGYGELPTVRLRSGPYEDTLVVEVKDRQDCELAAFDLATGKLLYKVSGQGAGDFGEYGRVSATVQQGCMALLGKNTLKLSRAP
jgi:outer membrane protein assembly factor BamB/tetratricopeptide (TPR) repeat protein